MHLACAGTSRRPCNHSGHDDHLPGRTVPIDACGRTGAWSIGKLPLLATDGDANQGLTISFVPAANATGRSRDSRLSPDARCDRQRHRAWNPAQPRVHGSSRIPNGATRKTRVESAVASQTPQVKETAPNDLPKLEHGITLSSASGWAWRSFKSLPQFVGGVL